MTARFGLAFGILLLVAGTCRAAPLFCDDFQDGTAGQPPNQKNWELVGKDHSADAIVIGGIGAGRCGGTALGAMGSFNVNAVPLPTVLSTRIRP